MPCWSATSSCQVAAGAFALASRPLTSSTTRSRRGHAAADVVCTSMAWAARRTVPTDHCHGVSDARPSGAASEAPEAVDAVDAVDDSGVTATRDAAGATGVAAPPAEAAAPTVSGRAFRCSPSRVTLATRTCFSSGRASSPSTFSNCQPVSTWPRPGACGRLKPSLLSCSPPAMRSIGTACSGRCSKCTVRLVSSCPCCGAIFTLGGRKGWAAVNQCATSTDCQASCTSER